VLQGASIPILAPTPLKAVDNSINILGARDIEAALKPSRFCRCTP
jgi:hypothetical protein